MKTSNIMKVILLAAGIIFLSSVAIAATLNVPANYSTIQGAINAANSYDTVLVAPGTYNENVVMAYAVTLRGSGPDVTTIRGVFASPTTGQPTVTMAQLSQIIGFRVTGGFIGISSRNVSSVIKNNVVEGNYLGGISLAAEGAGAIVNSSVINNTIANNLPDATNVLFGLYIEASDGGSTNPFIFNNIITGHGDGSVTTHYGILRDSGYVDTARYGYNDVWDNSVNYQNIPAGLWDITADPLYSNSKYNLGPSSPCIDEGDPDTIYNDVDGTRNDMGAYGGPEAHVIPSTTAYIYRDTFEYPDTPGHPPELNPPYFPPGDYNTLENNGTSEIEVATIGDFDGNSLEILRNTAGPAPRFVGHVNPSCSVSGKYTTVYGEMLSEQKPANGGAFVLRLNNGGIVCTILYIGNTISFQDGTGWNDTGIEFVPYINKAFHINVNFLTNTFTLYIEISSDGTVQQVGTDRPFQIAPAGSDRVIGFSFANIESPGNGYAIDEIQIRAQGMPDADDDSIADCMDACPYDPNNDQDGDGVCGDVDNCPNVANSDQADSDTDGLGNACDPCPNDPFNDADADGVCGNVDNCPNVANSDQEDADGDTFGDVCDSCPNDPNNDQDNDGVCEGIGFASPKTDDQDNCPEVANAGQENSDTDPFGDACDNCPDMNNTDGDGDGNADQCPYITPSSIKTLNETTLEMCFTNGGTDPMKMLNPSCCQMVFIGDDGTTIPVYTKLDIHCGPYMIQDSDQVPDYPTLPTTGNVVSIPANQEVCVTCDLENHFFPEELSGSSSSTALQSASTAVQSAGNLPLQKVRAYLTSDLPDGYFRGTIDFGEAEGNEADLSIISVEVDIKPGAYPNDINLGSKGKLPVGILGSTFYDVSNIDPTQCSVAGSSTVIKVKGKSGESPMASYEDLNGDGIQDLLVHVETQDLSIEEGGTTADVTCQTYDGLTVTGSDTINIVKAP